MIGIVTMEISKEEMMRIVELYLNDELFHSALASRNKATVVDQVRKRGDRFVITFEGKKAERPKTIGDSDLSRPSTEANGDVAVTVSADSGPTITHADAEQ